METGLYSFLNSFKVGRDRLTLQRKQSKLKDFLMNDGLIARENVCHVVDL